MTADHIRKAAARRKRASVRLEAAHAELQQAVVGAVRNGMGPKEAASHAGVSRQAVHDWLR